MARQGYQVLARKWRPQQFADVVGQQAVVRTLSNALAQARTAHAYCFSGIRGVGKTTIARLLAKGLNCRAGDAPTPTPCGACESCVEIVAGRSLDVIELDAASRTGVDDIRELNEVARYAPSRDRFKVMILDEAHMLSANAFNALLKTLEEPPPYLTFVLATTEPNKILPTILSRCQHYQFARISQRDIVAHLGRMAAAETVQISPDGLALVATAADGSLRDAQSLLDKLIAFAGHEIDEATVVELLGLVDRVLLFRAIELIAAGDAAGVLGFVNEMVEQGIELHQFTVDLLGHVRDLLVVRTVEDPVEILHLPPGDIDRLRAQAETFSLDDLDRGFQLLAANEYRIKLADQPRFHLEVALTRLARMPRLEPIEEILAGLRGGEGGGGGGERPSGGREPGTAARSPGGSSSTEGRSAAAPEAAGRGAFEPPATAPTPSRSTSVAVEEEAPPPPADATRPADRSLRGRIQRHMETDYPLVAQVLGRAIGVEVEGDRLTIQFPRSAAIFAQRVRAPEVQPSLRAACAAVVGRPMQITVDATADPMPDARDAGAASVDGEAPLDGHDVAADEPPGASLEGAARRVDEGAADAEAHEALRRRAEALPLVQDLVRELKGQVISVEEL